MNTSADHEAYIRAALHAAADSLEPRGDGLERIRARLQHARPRAVVWMLAARDALWLRVPAVLQDAYYSAAAAVWAVWDRFAPAPAPGKHRSRTQGLLRPLAAMAAVIFIVAAGTYVAISVSTAVSPSSSSSNPHNGQPGPGGHPGTSVSPSPSRSASGSVVPAHHASPSPSSPPASTSPGPAASPSCSSDAASPAPSASASDSPTDTPSDTSTDSSCPSAVATPGPSSSPGT